MVFASSSSQILGSYLDWATSASFEILSISSFSSYPTTDRMNY